MIQRFSPVKSVKSPFFHGETPATEAVDAVPPPSDATMSTTMATAEMSPWSCRVSHGFQKNGG
jgi:hypothetical protein